VQHSANAALISIVLLNNPVDLTFQEIHQPGLVPHISQGNSRTYPYEVIFRSLQKLLMDTASSEYLSI
jgi:hypothetical protein